MTTTITEHGTIFHTHDCDGECCTESVEIQEIPNIVVKLGAAKTETKLIAASIWIDGAGYKSGYPCESIAEALVSLALTLQHRESE